MTVPRTPRRTSVSALARSPRARWGVPAVVAVTVAGAFLAPPLLASADETDLPDLTPGQLVTAVAATEPTPLSGTVVYTARLGLPELPITEISGADPLALLGGSSTLRVWTDGAERSRVALLGATSEFSSVQDGAEGWTYSSAKDEVVHYFLSPDDAARFGALEEGVRTGALPGAGELPTPDEAARAALAHVEEFSTVTLGAETAVAGRPAYQLVVTPQDSATLVERVVIAVDAETSSPLRVQVWSTQDAAAPALEIGFTDVSFAAPADSVLAFSAPAGATVKDVVVPLPAPAELAAAGIEAQASAGDPAKALPEGVVVTGTGWESVTELSGLDVAGLVLGDSAAAGSLPGAERIIGSDSAQDLIGEFMPSEGSSGPMMSLDTSVLYDELTTQVPQGRLLSSTLLSVLITNDGRVLMGAVPAETLLDLA